MKKIVTSLLIVIFIGLIVISITNIDNTKAIPGPITFADEVISLSQGNSWNSGASGVYQTNGHEYRYVGANVNNYVKFNNDLYQIIGVFDSNSTGVSANLVKIIRARSIGGYSWGATNAASAYTTYSKFDSNWLTANANILLNEYFLNATDTSTTYKSCSDWTYYASNNNYKTKDCSKIIGYGIQTEDLRNYIQPVTWYLKGYKTYNEYSKQDFYTCERSDTITITNCDSGKGTAAKKVENKSIGLMYLSDYFYASGYYASTDEINVRGSNKQNWLYNGAEWTITPRGKGYTDNSYYVYSTNALYEVSYFPYALRPTFYLKSSVYTTGGNGSLRNPYTIACDDCNS